MTLSAGRFTQCYFGIVVRRCKRLATLTSVISGKPEPRKKLDMDAIYRGHDIHAGAWELLNPIGWSPQFYIGWWKAGQNIFQRVTLNEIFSPREEAERAGLLFAQKWVDQGKPNLRI